MSDSKKVNEEKVEEDNPTLESEDMESSVEEENEDSSTNVDEVEDEDSPQDELLDDDEQFLAGDDELIHSTESAATAVQADGLIRWEIENFHGANGKPKNRFSLRNDPPVLHVGATASDGEYESETFFILSREVTESLTAALIDVNNAYRGVQKKKKQASAFSQEGFSQRLNATLEWIKEHKIATGVIALFVIYAFISTVIY